MDKLIPVDYSGETPKVSARLLHSFLDVGTRFNDWFPRMAEYGFVEGKDFYSILSESTGGRPSQDYHITIPMAKELCMIQRTDKGKVARRYFIAIENAWNTPEMVMSRALKMAESNIASLRQLNIELIVENATLRPKAEMHDRFLSAENAQTMAVVAKSLGTGRDRLFKFLREQKVLMASNVPYQDYLNRGYFRVIEKVINMGGDEVIKPQTLVTAKGVKYIAKLLKSA